MLSNWSMPGGLWNQVCFITRPADPAKDAIYSVVVKPGAADRVRAAVAALRSKTTERFVTKLSPSNITKPLAAYFDASTSPSKRA